MTHGKDAGPSHSAPTNGEASTHMPVSDPLLTDREKRLLRRLAEQKSDHDIASEMGETEAQIAVQRERLLARLGILSQSDLEGRKNVSSVVVSPNQDQVMKEYQHSF